MEIEKSELIKRIALLERAIPGKSDIPCTEGILVKNSRMCTNDLKNAISIMAPEADSESFIIPQKAIAMVKNLPDGMVQLLPQSDGTLIIKAGSVRTKIKTFPVDDFPETFALEAADEATIDFAELVEMLSNVAYAVSENAARPVYTGILLDADGVNLNAVACDGFRCAWAHTEYVGTFKMVVPMQTVKILQSVRQIGQLKIRMRCGKAVFEIGGCKIYSQLLSGDFMDYHGIFPAREKSIGVEREKLLSAMSRIMICAEKNSQNQAISGVEMDGAGTTLQLKSNSSTVDYTEQLEVQDRFLSELRIRFNTRYVLEALKSYNCSVIDCFFGAKSTEPLILDDGDMKALLLPVRIADGK